MRPLRHNGRITAAALTAAAVFSLLHLCGLAYAQQVNRRNAVKKEETFTRPKPTRPIRPEIPKADRYRQDKVFLEQADSLFKVETRDTVDRQVVKGNVKFRQAGMWMYCDSAYYYPELNSLDAFGHVRMEQGDTLFVYADILYYEGNDRMARLKNGPSCPKVKLINRDVTLTTDSLDYSLAMELGWYERYGTIDDKVNTLTSLYGEYSPGTKNADFYHEVVLVNNRDGYTMLTDTLHYSTATHLARIESPTEIQGANDTIITTRGLYDTEAGNAELLSRSMIIHRDSNNNVTTLEGDSIIYDKQSRISRAFMFRGPGKHPLPMVLTDTARKTALTGGFGLYNDSTREALATMYPMLMEYSQGDTLFLRADTIRTYIITERVADTRKRTASGYPEWQGQPVVRIDSTGIWFDPAYFSPPAPMSEKPLALLLAALPDKGRRPGPPVPTPLAGANHPPVPEPPHPGELAGNFPADSVPIDELPVPAVPADTLVADTVPMIEKEYHMALAYHRARFFKQDLQGVADSIVVVERDSMLYMFRRPIVWSGERQVTGNRIDVHFNDSTADWALLPESGIMSEHVGEDFYNQLAGKKMLARFADNTLRTLEVSGNVETIFLPQENDSTFNRLIQAESSYLTIDMDSNRIDRLKMWPEVSGTVTPLFMVKRQQQYLRQFRWWDMLRPARAWYGDRWHWDDALGEVSDELEQYLTSPSDFGTPKSFPASRPEPLPAIIPLESPNAIKADEQQLDLLEDEVESQSRGIEKEVEHEEQQAEETNE